MVPNTVTHVQVPSTGANTVYAYPNKIDLASDLSITAIDASGNTYPFVFQSGAIFVLSSPSITATVTGVDVDTGSTVTLSAPLTAGWFLDIRSNIPRTQTTSIKNQGTFLPDLHEEAFDRITRQLQDLNRKAYGFGIHGPDIENTAWTALPSATARANTALVFDANGLPSVGILPSTAFTQSLWDAYLGATNALFPRLNWQQSSAEVAANVVPTNFSYPPYTPQRLGVKADNATDDTAAWARNILVASQIVAGAAGATVDASKLTGLTLVSSQIVLPNRVRIKGPNASGLIFTATSTHPGPYMFYANNGSISMFDSILEDLYIDCNNVAGLSAIRTDAWQENSGLRSVGIKNCTTYGLHFFNVGAGGQSTCELQQIQFFGAATGTIAGIKVDQISSVGAFQIHLRDSVIAGVGILNNIARGVDMVNDSLLAENCHFEDCLNGIYLDGVGTHVINHCSGSSTTTNLVHIAATFTGRVVVMGCQRNTSPVLIQNDVTGETITNDVPLYVYPNVSSQNTAKAWCFFNGTTAGTNPPLAGNNVASVQRLSTGRYKVSLTNQTLNANIAPIASSNQNASGAREWCQAVNAASFLVNLDVSGTPTDAGEVHVIAFAQ